MDTRQGTHTESFLSTRSVPGLLMNGCSESAERAQFVGRAGGVWGGLCQVGASGQSHEVWRPGVGVGACCPSRTLPVTSLAAGARGAGPLTSYEHVGAGRGGALDAGLNVLVVAAIAARVVGVGLGKQQHLAVGPGIRAFAVANEPQVFTVLFPRGWRFLSPWPGPLEGVLPPGRGGRGQEGLHRSPRGQGLPTACLTQRSGQPGARAHTRDPAHSGH